MQYESKTVFISWQPYCSRSDNFAREFNGKSHMIYYDFFGSNYFTILFKYFFQAITTLIILLRDMPEVVFVMSPPLFANLPVFIYSKIFGKKYIIDAHTGAMIDSMWKNVRWLQKFFCRHAVFTIITNMDLAGIFVKWKVDYLIVPDVRIRIAEPVLPVLNSKKNVTLVNTFAKDEPLSEFLKAADKFTDIRFFVTGKMNQASEKFINEAGRNVKFTGFLPYSEYYGLLLKSDVIVVLTTRDSTMQRGAYEAIYLGKPVITSDWEILRNNFDDGTVFVHNSEKSIAAGIEDVFKNLPELEQGAERLKKKKISRWNKNKSAILLKLENK